MRVLLLIFVTISVNANQSFIQASISGKTIQLEVANTQALRSQGLMGVNELADNQGMIFIWPGAARRCMWMKNTYIPLNVAYIDTKGKILEIYEMLPLSEDSICSKKRVKYALEVNLDWFKRNNVNVGDQMDITEILDNDN